MIVTFEGGSDDIVSTGIGASIKKLKRDEEYVDREHRAVFEVRTPGKTRGVAVVATYEVHHVGTWLFAYGLIDEGAQLPPWAFTFERAHDYSMRLVIDTIEDLVELVKVWPKEGG